MMNKTSESSKSSADKLVEIFAVKHPASILQRKISALCRREGIAESLYYKWSKEFLEAGKRRLSGDTERQATSPEVKELRSEALALKECVADLTLENRLLKKSMTGVGEELE